MLTKILQACRARVRPPGHDPSSGSGSHRRRDQEDLVNVDLAGRYEVTGMRFVAGSDACVEAGQTVRGPAHGRCSLLFLASGSLVDTGDPPLLSGHTKVALPAVERARLQPLVDAWSPSSEPTRANVRILDGIVGPVVAARSLTAGRRRVSRVTATCSEDNAPGAVASGLDLVSSYALSQGGSSMRRA